MSRLHSTQDRFAEQNPPLQLLLGLLSATGRVERMLPTPTAGDASPTEEPDRFVALLLGVVAFRRGLLALLESACAEPSAPEVPAPGSGAPRNLLR